MLATVWEAVGVLAAVADDRIRYLISLAGMVNTKDFYDREFGDEKPDEGCMWEDPNCPISSIYKSDMYSIVSVASKAKEINIPWLLVHGDADDVVPIEDSREILNNANEHKQIVEIPNADHVFSDGGFEQMKEAVIDWVGQSIRLS